MSGAGEKSKDALREFRKIFLIFRIGLPNRDAIVNLTIKRTLNLKITFNHTSSSCIKFASK